LPGGGCRGGGLGRAAPVGGSSGGGRKAAVALGDAAWSFSVRRSFSGVGNLNLNLNLGPGAAQGQPPWEQPGGPGRFSKMGQV
ncbi:MAG: hypothetical protein ACE362_28545, partial [Phaeodactylibacter xiamenensis]